MKPNIQRLTFEIDRSLHASIRTIAFQKHMTMKSWVLTAIAKALQEEQIHSCTCYDKINETDEKQSE